MIVKKGYNSQPYFAPNPSLKEHVLISTESPVKTFAHTNSTDKDTDQQHSSFPPLKCSCSPLPPSHVTLDNMKFPKPRTLLQNEYPDLIVSQPDLFKDMVINFNKPPVDSEMDTYIDASIQHLKTLHKQKQNKLKVNNLSVSSRLSYVYITIPPNKNKIKCLIVGMGFFRCPPNVRASFWCPPIAK